MNQPKKYASWWVRIGYFIRFLFVLAMLIGTVYFAVFKTDWFVIKHIEIKCNRAETQVLLESFKTHFEGKNIFLISMGEAIRELEEDPYVAEIQLKRSFPDKIQFNVLMREEKAAFYYNKMYLFLDASGMLLRIDTEVEDQLVLKGFPVRSFVVGRPLELENQTALKNALRLINLVDQTAFEEQPQIQYEEEQIILRLNERFKGKFGNGGEIEHKYNAFLDIYHDLQSKGIQTGVVDVSHKGYPVYEPFGE